MWGPAGWDGKWEVCFRVGGWQAGCMLLDVWGGMIMGAWQKGGKATIMLNSGSEYHDGLCKVRPRHAVRF